MSPPPRPRPRARAGGGTTRFSNVLCQAVAVRLLDDSTSEVRMDLYSLFFLSCLSNSGLVGREMLCSLATGPPPFTLNSSKQKFRDPALTKFPFVLWIYESRSPAFTYRGTTVRLLVAGMRERIRAESRLQATPGAAYGQVGFT